MKSTKEQVAFRVSAITIVINVVLSVFKLIAGIFAKSGAMLSDAVHSISDVFSTFVVMIGIKFAGKKADKEHPYGHERAECVAAIILSVMLFITGLGICVEAAKKVISGNYETLAIPGVLALIAAFVSIAVKEGMYWYTRAAAKKVNSGALMADAWHHRSDALSSIGSFIGIFGARLGFPVLDPIASVVICIFIIKAAVQIFIDAVNKMMDKSADDEEVAKLRSAILKQEGVLGVDKLTTRLFGDRIYVDVEISADGSLSLKDAHTIAERVHDAIEDDFEDVKHCMVHVNPSQ